MKCKLLLFFCIVHVEYASEIKKCLMVLYRFLPLASKGDVETNTYTGVHSSKWEYWFKTMGKNQ